MDFPEWARAEWSGDRVSRVEVADRLGYGGSAPALARTESAAVRSGGSSTSRRRRASTTCSRAGSRGHDTSYSPNGETVNRGEDCTYADADVMSGGRFGVARVSRSGRLHVFCMYWW